MTEQSLPQTPGQLELTQHTKAPALPQSRLTQHCHSCRQNDSLGIRDLLQPLLRLVRA